MTGSMLRCEKLMSDPTPSPKPTPPPGFNPLQQVTASDSHAGSLANLQEAVQRVRGPLGIQLPPLLLILAVFGIWITKQDTHLGSTAWLVVSGLVALNYLHSANQGRKLSKLSRLLDGAPPETFRPRPRPGAPKRR